MFDIELRPCDVPKHRMHDLLVACVQIVGDWMGTVRMDISFGLARKAAASSLGLDPDQVKREQVRDCAGELANITAGSLKELLPFPCGISLPIVADGKDFTFEVQNVHKVLESAFDHNGEKCLITVLEANHNRR